MGMYTELILGASLKKDTPTEVINVLKYLLGDIKDAPINPDFDFIINNRNPLMGGSYYFAVDRPIGKIWFDSITHNWRISSRSNIKNYEGEIESFLAWLKPYIEKGSGSRGLYAMTHYEENEVPTFYFLLD